MGTVLSIVQSYGSYKELEKKKINDNINGNDNIKDERKSKITTNENKNKKPNRKKYIRTIP